MFILLLYVTFFTFCNLEILFLMYVYFLFYSVDLPLGRGGPAGVVVAGVVVAVVVVGALVVVCFGVVVAAGVVVAGSPPSTVPENNKSTQCVQ